MLKIKATQARDFWIERYQNLQPLVSKGQKMMYSNFQRLYDNI